MQTESSNSLTSTEQPSISQNVIEAPPQNTAPTAEPPSANTDNAEVPPPKPTGNSVKKLVILGGLGLIVMGVCIYGYRWWHFSITHQETDDAYITTDIHPVNARIAGTVTEVAVADNQTVQSEAVLVKLDPRDYQVALQQAQATLKVTKYQADASQLNISVTSTNAQGQTTQALGNIDAAEASILTAKGALSEARAGVPLARAQVAEVEANLEKAKLDYDRYQSLAAQGAIPQSQFDAIKATYNSLVAQRNTTQEQVQQAVARLEQARQNLSNAEAKFISTKGTLDQANATDQQTEVNRRQYQSAIAAIEQAQAQVDNAKLQLSYTTILSPSNGVVGNKTVQVGQRVQSGQTLMSVATQQPWIVANFKETQLGKMHAGQAVEIRIDAFPNHIFTGKVDSLSPASGAKFALLPPDNATGNFTKIVQRLPVKIVFDGDSIRGYESRIAAGMSVVVTVATDDN